MPKKEKEDKQELQSVEETSEEKTEEAEETPVEPVEEKAKAPKKPASAKKFKTGRKHLAAKEKIKKGQKYSIEDALGLIKETSYVKFDASIDVHIKTSTKKGQESLRGLVALPAGAAKQQKIVVADEAIINEIKSGKINFDVLIATPALMPKLATVAKILGPRGLMPSPKSGTVAEDPKTALEEFSKGRVEFKADPLGNIHVSFGKVSWDKEKLVTNVNAVISAIPTNRVVSVYLAATMGPGVRVI